MAAQPGAFCQDSDPGDGGYKPPPYYTAQTAQVGPTFTATSIPKPPISSYTSTPAPDFYLAPSAGSEVSLNSGSTVAAPSISTYSSVPARYAPAPTSVPWPSKAPLPPAPQPVDNSDSPQEDN